MEPIDWADDREFDVMARGWKAGIVTGWLSAAATFACWYYFGATP